MRASFEMGQQNRQNKCGAPDRTGNGIPGRAGMSYCRRLDLQLRRSGKYGPLLQRNAEPKPSDNGWTCSAAR